jgi:DNA-binding transcriptional LysR family regulator
MVLQSIDANLLVALHALLREQNVTRAARRVGREQSSMSHALARLRDHFGDPLLVRAGRDLVLTERARALVQPVEAAVREVERVFAPADPFDPRTATRVFHLGATDNLELYVLPALVAVLAEEAPLLDLRSYHLPSDWPQALARGDLDLKLGREYPLPAELHAEPLCEERFVGVVREGHPLARARPTLAAYAGAAHLAIAPAAVPGAAVRGSVDAALARRGLSRRVALTVSHFLVAPHLVARSDLVLTAPERLVAAFLGPLRLKTFSLPLRLRPYRLTQVWAERAHHDPAHRFLREAVRRALELAPPSTPSMAPVATIHSSGARPAPRVAAQRRTR